MKDYQRKLFPYAYNILGTTDDARDAVQDVLVRYIADAREDIGNETGYLIKSVINQSINIKKRKQKLVTGHVWLPEPVATDSADGELLRSEIISYSMLVLLEHLNPKERAVFVLKEAFDYSHEDIADTLSISVENSRKLLSRAKSKLGTARKETPEMPRDTSGYFEEYMRVLKNGDVKALEKMLAEEISILADGGGKVRVASEWTAGRESAAQLTLYVYHTYLKTMEMEVRTMNHQPALLFFHNNTLISCQVFEFVEGTDVLRRVYSVVDPAKLMHLAGEA